MDTFLGRQYIGIAFVSVGLCIIAGYFCFSKQPFVNVGEIGRKYWESLKSKRERLVFFGAPLILGMGFSFISPLSRSVSEVICTVISILLGILFATLGALASFSSSTQTSDPQHRYANAFNDTINIILYLACLSVVNLFLLIVGLVYSEYLFDAISGLWPSIRFVDSIFIYSLSFALLLNCLVVIKRISRLIQKK